MDYASMNHPLKEPVESTSSCSSDACCGPSPTPAVPLPAVDSHDRRSFFVATMDCTSEESEIRRAVAHVGGVRAMTFQLGQRTLSIDAQGQSLDQALSAIRQAGFDPQPVAARRPGAAVQGVDDAHAGHVHESGGAGEIKRLAIALLLAIVAEAIGYLMPDAIAWKAAGLAVAAAAIGFAGLAVYKKGLAALVHGRLNINALMTVAVTGAFVIGQWPEAAMVMALYAIAEAIEARAVDRARNAIKGLLAMAPEEALVRQNDGTWQTVPAAGVELDAIVQVRPGERVPIDGVVVTGTTSIDQAPVTGESVPVDKSPGDAVYAGTVNVNGTFELRATALASNSTLARIIHAVEEAQGSRAPTQGLVDRFAAVYTPAVFAIALAVALLGPWLLGWTWPQAVYKALVLLVIACPCALVISTPVTIVSALAAAARRGILIKGGIFLEQARKLKVVALDKTGTITEGKPKLVGCEAINPAEADRVQVLAAALAAHSDHPVSRAITQGLPPSTIQVNGFQAVAGRGVQASVDGQPLFLANHRMIEERGLCSPALESRLRQHENAGHTVTLLASDEAVLAIFAVADTVKPSSREAVASLRALGISTVMLSGDNQTVATAIAREAGIDEARGGLLPEDKLAAIRSLQAERGFTAMVGDGINDAPALAQADIGIAMGAAGTDTAMETADIVVMNDDLRRIAETVRLSRSTRTVLWQNIAVALGFKVVFFALAVFGSATMWMAVFADMGASLLVVVNGLRLLSKGKRPA